MTSNKPVPVGSTERAFDILQSIRTSGVQGVSAIAEELDIPTSTANDHLQSLVRLGYLDRTDEGYRLGLRLLELGEAARRDRTVVTVGKDEVDRLATQTGEHANLMIAEHGRGIFVYKARGENAVQLDTHPGMVVPLHTTALGKSILAYMEESRVEDIIERHGLEEVTEKTITDPSALYEQLETIREQGFARDDEERVEGMRCVAAPIRSDGNVVGAVSTSGPVNRFNGERYQEEVPNHVKSAANVIEVNLQHI